MNNLIQTFCKKFVDDWEKRSVEADFCLRFPQVFHLMMFIRDTSNRVQQQRLFESPNIEERLNRALIAEINMRMEQYTTQTDTQTQAA